MDDRRRFPHYRAAVRLFQLTFAGNGDVELTMGEGPDHGLYDVYIGGSLWQSFNGYAASAGERVIPISLTNDGPFTLQVNNRADKGSASSGHVMRFKQLSVDAEYMLQTIDYTYDSASRVLDANYYPGENTASTPAQTFAYEYDVAGNLTDNNGAVSTFNKLNQISSGSVTYDANGNMTNDGTNTYTWDRANRLLSMGGHDYIYDGLGNRVSQTASSILTQYLLDLQPGLVQVIAATVSSDTERYIHTPRGIHTTQDASDDWRYTVQDGLGSVRGEIEIGFDIGASGAYEPYGVPTSVDGAYTQPFRFTGEMRDETELQFHRARYYAPAQGLWTGLDPFEGLQIVRPESLNVYAWVEGNTVNAIDPSGKCIDSQICDNVEPGSIVWYLIGCKSHCNNDLVDVQLDKLKALRRRVDVTPDLQLDMLDFLGDTNVLYIRDRIRTFNMPFYFATPQAIASVFEVFIDLVKSGAPLDVKLKYRSQFNGDVVWLANDFYNVDITGNMLYGYIGEYVDIGQLLLSVGAGLAQLQDTPSAVGPITCFFDDCADQAAIAAGIQLYRLQGVRVNESGIAEVLDQQSGRLQVPQKDYWKRPDVDIDIGYVAACLAPDTYQNRLIQSWH